MIPKTADQRPRLGDIPMQLQPGYSEIETDALNVQEVVAVWTYYSETDTQHCILPDGRADLILTFILDEKGIPQGITPIISPPNTRSRSIPLTAHQGFVGLRFKAGAAGSFLNAQQQNLTGDILYGKNALALLRLSDSICAEQKSVGHLIDNLNKHICSASPHATPSDVTDILELIHESQGTGKISDIAAQVNLTERTLNRKLIQSVGLSPKAYASIVRLHNALDCLADEKDDIACIAADCGFSDQAHMTREFKQFAGTTPGILHGRTHEGLLL